MIEFLFLFINLLFAIFIFFLCISFITGAPFVPSFKKSASSMITLAHITPGMNIVDLGSGDGRLLFLAASYGAKAIGYEINPILVLYTMFRAFFSSHRRSVSVYWKNFWSADINSADVVFVYLLPWKMNELQSMLEQHLKPQTLIVTNSFMFPDWIPIRSDIGAHVYVYQIPQTKTIAKSVKKL